MSGESPFSDTGALPVSWRYLYWDMTLGEAVEQGPIACGCVGPCLRTCPCRLRFARVAELRRAAHIVARQLSDLATGRSADPGA